MTYGVKSISMDDIARSIGISKKTIYQYYQNKKDLIKHVVEHHIKDEQAMVDSILENAMDAVEELVTIARFNIQMLKATKPTVIFDLKKYYQESWELLEDFQHGYIEQTITQNLEKGIKAKLYRQDINASIIAKIYSGNLSHIADDMAFPPSEYKREELYKEFIKLHLFGISTPKGLMRWEELKANQL